MYNENEIKEITCIIIEMFVKTYDLSCINDLLENGNIISKDWIFNNKKYKILKYDKTRINDDTFNTMAFFRSVIMSNNNILSFSPEKSRSNSYFLSIYSENECVAEEYVEGTMINLFYDKEISKWEIATKTSVGANIRFFKDQKNFNTLFNEVCNYLKININNFDKQYSYSFVMQHPENRFVIPITEMRLYLISIYKIDNECKKIYEIPKVEYQNLNLPETLNYPFGHYFDTFSNLLTNYASLNTPTTIMGIVVKHKNGDRTKFRNPNYEHVKKLRGNNCKLQFQYLTLHKENKINEYLQYYPENRKLFNDYRTNLFNFTAALFNNYVECYIKKARPLKEYPFQYRNHMFALHELYLKIKVENKIINFQEVIKYVKSLDPARLMFSLNYHLRDLSNPCDLQKNNEATMEVN